MIVATIDAGNGNHWQLGGWEIVISQNNIKGMSAQEIGELVIRLHDALDETREEYYEREMGFGLRYKSGVKSPRNEMGGKNRTRIYAQLVHRDGEFCQVPNCENVDLEIDHIIPISAGGTNELENLQFLCKHHNCSKGTKTWNEFLNGVIS